MDNRGCFCFPHRLLYTQLFDSFGICWNVLDSLEERDFYTNSLKFTQKIKVKRFNRAWYQQSFQEWGGSGYDLFRIFFFSDFIFPFFYFLIIYSQRLICVQFFWLQIFILIQSDYASRSQLKLVTFFQLILRVQTLYDLY